MGGLVGKIFGDDEAKRAKKNKRQVQAASADVARRNAKLKLEEGIASAGRKRKKGGGGRRKVFTSPLGLTDTLA